MGDVIDDIGDAVGDVADVVGDTVTGAVDWAAEAAVSSVEFVAASTEAAVNIGASVATGDWDGVVDAGEDFGGALVDHFEDMGESFVGAAGIAANLAGGVFQATVPQGLLEAVDDVGIFDAVDTVTGGIVDVNAADGKFDFQIGDPDVFGVGITVGAAELLVRDVAAEDGLRRVPHGGDDDRPRVDHRAVEVEEHDREAHAVDRSERVQDRTRSR